MDEKSLNMDQRVALLKQQPVFALLTLENIQELAQLMDQVVFPPNEPIVREGEAVDIIYVISEGAAKVVRTLPRADKVHYLDIKILYPGDSIGFSPEGLFSATGLRMSTVVAQTKVVCLAINLHTLYEYFSSAKAQYPDLKQELEEFLMTNFIIMTDLFSYLTENKVENIKKHIRKVQLATGAQIYQTAQQSDDLYYILSGAVQINTGTKTSVCQNAVLHQDPSAVCLNNCEFLVLNPESVAAYIKPVTTTSTVTLIQKIKNFFSGRNNEQI